MYVYMFMCVCMYVLIYGSSMYCFYVGIDYTYIDINALAHVCFVCVCARAREFACMYMCVCMYMYACMYMCVG